MNESTPSDYTPSLRCFLYIVGLRHALAGDLESGEHIDFLENRWRSISWDDPEFIRVTDDMRAGIPQLTPEQEKSLQAPLVALLHAMSERLASYIDSERINSLQLQELKEKMIQSHKLAMDGMADSARIAAYAEKLTDLAIKMRDRLEQLHDDVSVFKFPEI